jgi:hypothetical protein
MSLIEMAADGLPFGLDTVCLGLSNEVSVIRRGLIERERCDEGQRIIALYGEIAESLRSCAAKHAEAEKLHAQCRGALCLPCGKKEGDGEDPEPSK